MNSPETGWDPAGRSYPYRDDNIESVVYAHHGPFMVSVSPQLFNDRVLLSHRDGYPRAWVAGFCYPKGPAAGLAAMTWNPLTEAYPPGHVRIAGDSRTPDQMPAVSDAALPESHR